MANRTLTRQLRRIERLDEKLRKNREALRRRKRRLRARIARAQTRGEREIERKRRNAEKAKESRKRAAERKRRQQERVRKAQERESMKRDMKERQGVAETREERSSRLIRLGGLVVIAGLLGMDLERLLAWLEAIAKSEKFEACREVWRRIGRRAAATWKATGRDTTRPDLTTVPASKSPKRAFAEHVHQLATLGGVINQAGLGDEDAMVVLGILVSTAEHEAGRDWTQLPQDGGNAERTEPARGGLSPRLTDVTIEAIGPEQVMEPLRLVFPRAIDRSLGSDLQDLGLAYLPDCRAWFGVADKPAVGEIARSCGGVVTTWSVDSPEIRTALAFVQRRRERLATALKTPANPPASASRRNSPEKR